MNIGEWLSRKRSEATIKREKREVSRKLEREQRVEQETAEWKGSYFQGIVFPIVILTAKDYLAVSDLAEYYYDTDINIWFIKSDYELIDSTGQKYGFQQIEKGQWVPNDKIGTMTYDELKDRLVPMLYMPEHEKQIDTTISIKDIIELLTK